MGFPVHIYGEYGDERLAQSTRIGNLPLGTRMILPDGRIYAHARCDTATALTNGILCIMAATASSSHVSGLAAEAAVGSGTIGVTLSASGAVTEDLYRDGYVWGNDGTGQGHAYRIAACNSGAVSTTVTFTIEEPDTMQVAFGAGTTKVGLKQNEFDGVIISAAATSQAGPYAGVPSVAVSAGFYFWLQRRGVCTILSGVGTASESGKPIAQNLGGAGGDVQRWTAAADTSTAGDAVIGYCISAPAASLDHELDYLTLE